MKRAVFAITLLLTLAMVGPAAAFAPSILFWADKGLARALDVPLQLGNDGVYYLDKFVYKAKDYTVTLRDVRIDPDPFIDFTVGLTTGNAPIGVTFGFTNPIVPTGSPNVVDASVSGSLTDERGDGLTATPIQSKLVVGEVGAPSPLTNMGVDVGDVFTAGAGDPGAIYDYGTHSAGPFAGPGPGPWTVMHATIAFTLTPYDQALFTGHVGIAEGTAPVPEPASVALLGLGLLGGLAGWLRRRRAV